MTKTNKNTKNAGIVTKKKKKQNQQLREVPTVQANLKKQHAQQTSFFATLCRNTLQHFCNTFATLLQHFRNTFEALSQHGAIFRKNLGNTFDTLSQDSAMFRITIALLS